MPRRGWNTCRVWWPPSAQWQVGVHAGLSCLLRPVVRMSLFSQGWVSVDWSMIRGSRGQETLKWNVAAALSWTSMPTCSPEIWLRILRTAENMRGHSVLEASVVSIGECMVPGATSSLWFKLMGEVGQSLRWFSPQNLWSFYHLIDKIEPRQRVLLKKNTYFFLVSFGYCCLGFVCSEASSLSSLRLHFLFCWRRLISVFSHHFWSAHHLFIFTNSSVSDVP